MMQLGTAMLQYESDNDGWLPLKGELADCISVYVRGGEAAGQSIFH